MKSRLNSRGSEYPEELVLLSHQGALEMIHELLLEGDTHEARALSDLLATAPSLPIPGDAHANALEATLRDCINRNAFDDGIRAFEARYLEDVPSPEVERLAGICYGWDQQDERARHHLIRAWSRGSEQAILDLATLERRALRFTRSARLLERVRSERFETHEKHSDELDLQTAETEVGLGMFEAARQRLLSALERSNLEYDAASLRAQALATFAGLEFQMGRFSHALASTNQGLATQSDARKVALLRTHRALLLAALGQGDEARAACESIPDASRLDLAEYAMMLHARGLLAWLEGDRAQALEFLRAAANHAAQHGVRHILFLVAGQLSVLNHQLGDLEAMHYWRDQLQDLLEPGLSGTRFERFGRLADAYVHLAESRAESALELLAVEVQTPTLHGPLEVFIAHLLAAEAHLTRGQIEAGRRMLLSVLDWRETHERTPLVALALASTPRALGYARVSGDPKLASLYAQFAARYGAPLEAIHLVTLTDQPEVRFGDWPVPLGNRHVVPLLSYLHAKGTCGATVAEIGRDLFPELRGERLRNRVKNARVELYEAIESAIRAAPERFDGLTNLRITSEGNTRSMTLRLESGDHAVRWDLEELERALDSTTGDWVWLLTAYRGDFLEGYDLEGDEHWVQLVRDRLRAKLLERAAGLIADWFARGRLEPLRSLVTNLFERGILDLVSPLADVIAAYEVRAVGTMAGKEAALAVWLAHAARFRAAFVDAPELEAVHPVRGTG